MDNQNVYELRNRLYELLESEYIIYIATSPDTTKIFEYEIMVNMFNPEAELFTEEQLKAALVLYNPFHSLKVMWNNSPDPSYNGRLNYIRNTLALEYQELNLNTPQQASALQTERKFQMYHYPTEKEVAEIKKNYPPGTEIVVNEMNDPRPVPAGTRGRVSLVDDMGTLHCVFENGRRLGVIPGEDNFTVIKQEQTQTQPKTRVFVDMDGTLAVFRRAAKIEELLEKDYFATLKPNPRIIETTKLLNQNPNYEVFILSSVLTDSKYAIQEKTEWNNKYLPEIRPDHIIYSECGKNKTSFVPDGIRSTDILLDDYTVNLKEWEQAGGKAVKVINGINDTTNKWAGAKIFFVDEAEISLQTINNVAQTPNAVTSAATIQPNEIAGAGFTQNV